MNERNEMIDFCLRKDRLRIFWADVAPLHPPHVRPWQERLRDHMTMGIDEHENIIIFKVDR